MSRDGVSRRTTLPRDIAGNLVLDLQQRHALQVYPAERLKIEILRDVNGFSAAGERQIEVRHVRSHQRISGFLKITLARNRLQARFAEPAGNKLSGDIEAL